MELEHRRTPTELRRVRRQHALTDPECYRFLLAYSPPYDWETLLAFLSARATPGVESVAESRYRRTIEIGGKSGVIDVSHLESAAALHLKVCFPDPRALLVIVERVRRIFDLGADPALIAEHLAPDPLLGPLLAGHQGIRTPGAWDGFELAVRAILGQQISVRGATTLAGRLAEMFGDQGPGEFARLFPSPARLASAPIERAGVMPTRALTIRTLARQVIAGSVSFGPCVDVRAAVSALKRIPGIGDWTAEYIAMRALSEPDAFPSGDLVLRRMAGDCTTRELERRAESWRPWRAYATMLLWQGANQGPVVRGQGSGVSRRIRDVSNRSERRNGGDGSAHVRAAHSSR